MTAAVPEDDNTPAEAREAPVPGPMRDYLDARSPLARNISGFVPREQQIAFADAVARTIAARGALIADAGTGTGKTFA